MCLSSGERWTKNDENLTLRYIMLRKYSTVYIFEKYDIIFVMDKKIVDH